MAHSIPNLRPDATKNYILITDAPVHEKKPIIDIDGDGIDDHEIAESIKYSNYNIQDILNMLDGEVKVTVIINANENLTKAESLLLDTDIAKETMKLKKDQIILQSA